MSDRLHTIEASWAKDAFLRAMSIKERLGQPFEYDVEFLSTVRDIAPEKALGHGMTVSVKLNETKKRHFHGLVSQFVNSGPRGQFQVYHVKLRPWIWFLQRAADCRIFQQKSVTEILTAVFKEKHGFSDFKVSVTSSYPKYEYCVQYRESDLAFVSRLMEQEGIYYYFTHDVGKHTLVFVDQMSSHQAIEGTSTVPYRPPGEAYAGLEHVSGWMHQVEVQSGTYALRDFDFEKPKTDLSVALKGDRSHPLGLMEVYDYPGGFREVADGNRNVRIRLEESHSQFIRIDGASNCMSFAAGNTFTLSEHPRDAENAKYLLMATDIEIESGEVEQFRGAENRFEVKFQAMRSKDVYRSPRTTAKPIIAGPQTAIVVGKNGEEIWTDSYGRVKVQFPWDREGKKDENSSCWVRVSHNWAGKAWGAIQIPRIGQEVIVEFLEGDPDQPIITGRVYNADQTVPYELPKMQTQSGVKTRSTANGDPTHFNELRFEDKKDAEEIYFHAEKDFVRVVENNDSLTVGKSKKDKGDQTVEIFNNQTIKVGGSEAPDGSQELTIWNNRTTVLEKGKEDLNVKEGSRTTAVKLDDTLTISDGSRITTVKKDDTLTVQTGNQTIDISSGECKIKAAQAITLEVGGSSIKITPSKIEIKSAEVDVNGDMKTAVKSGMKVEVNGTMVQLSGSAMLEVKGGIVKIN